MHFALTFIAIACSIIFFSVKIGAKILIAIIKGIVKLCKSMDESHFEKERERYENSLASPREEKEMIDGKNAALENQKEDHAEVIIAELARLYYIAKDIDMEALLIQQPESIEESNKKEEARDKLTYVRKRMYELIKFECNELTDFEKDFCWNMSWQGIDSARATDSEKLNHAITYIKMCGEKLMNPPHPSLDEQLGAAVQEQLEKNTHEAELIQ